ncbi:Ribosomal RNA-processing protein 7-like protein A, partial [Bienertia sinuspersici]
ENAGEVCLSENNGKYSVTQEIQDDVAESDIKGKSQKARKNKRKYNTSSSEPSTMANDGQQIEALAENPKKTEKDKSKKARKNKSKYNSSSSEPSTVANDGHQIEALAENPKKTKKVKSKKTHKKKKDGHETSKLVKGGHSTNEIGKLVKDLQEDAMPDVYQISSGEEDDSKGMTKWIKEFHKSRPGLKILQEQIDNFITAHEEQEEQARREREAKLAEEGWTVVVHRKGGKKTADPESGIAVGSVAEAAVRDKLTKKKSKDVGLDFYRFQRKEAQMSELMKLQSKFQEDKKRIQQLRAARKSWSLETVDLVDMSRLQNSDAP